MYRNMNLAFIGAFVLVMSLTSCASIREPDFATTDAKIGSGAEAVTGQLVAVQYIGWFYDGGKPNYKGKRFDASEPGKPFIFKLGVGQVIKGWDMGVPGMKVGGRRTLVIPSDLAYGRRGAGSKIPPDSSLIFDIELLEVR